MDKYCLWDDTMLIVNTDHGFLLGEHNWWGKTVQPYYNEIVNIPLFIWDPRCKKEGERRSALVQTIDIAPTILDYFNVDIPKDMQGVPLRDVIAADAKVREAALFGIHGGHVNCTDGRYVYMHAPVSPSNEPLFNYTLMPAHMTSLFSIRELKTIELAGPFAFTKGCRTMKIKSDGWNLNPYEFGTMLFDLHKDPEQRYPIMDKEVEDMMRNLMVRLMKMNDAPKEQYERLGLAL